MQKIQIVYPGCENVLHFTDLLEALEQVVNNGHQQNFMIKPDESQPWQDGAVMFKGFQKMFEPIRK